MLSSDKKAYTAASGLINDESSSFSNFKVFVYRPTVLSHTSQHKLKVIISFI